MAMRVAAGCMLLGACSGSAAVTDPFFTSDASGDAALLSDAAPVPTQVTLTVARVGQGNVTSLPAGIDCGASCSAQLLAGTTSILKAVPAVGWEFGGWDGAPTCKGSGACAVTLGADTKVTATFFQPKSSLTVTKTGNGTVTSAPAGISCGATCTASFDTGSNVTLTPSPAGGNIFVGWSGACGGSGPCVVTMNGPQTVTATFQINYTTWDPSWNVPGVFYSNGNRTISGSSAGSKNVRTLVGKSSGKWYWEVTAIGGDGATNAGGIGILEAGMLNNVSYIGSGPSGSSFGYGSCCTTIYYTNWAGTTLLGGPPAGAAIKSGNVYMFALDMDLKRAWYGHNGTWYNGGNPAANVSPAISGLSGLVYPGVTFYSSSINAFTANFGQVAFTYGVPAGFTAGLY